MSRIQISGLAVDSALHDFIVKEALPGTGISYHQGHGKGGCLLPLLLLLAGGACALPLVLDLLA